MATIRELNEQRLSLVMPRLGNVVSLFVEQCALSGFDVLVTQGLRTWKEQDALYAQGRTKPGKIVTKAKGGQSYHNFGLGVDLVPLTTLGKADWDVRHPQWKILADIGKKLDLEWGGDWKGFKDMPHFQITGNVKLQTLRTLYAKTKSLPACWDHIEAELKRIGYDTKKKPK